jgi:hypothetical protein
MHLLQLADPLSPEEAIPAAARRNLSARAIHGVLEPPARFALSAASLHFSRGHIRNCHPHLRIANAMRP